jgi:hypothetical protein
MTVYITGADSLKALTIMNVEFWDVTADNSKDLLEELAASISVVED